MDSAHESATLSSNLVYNATQDNAPCNYLSLSFLTHASQIFPCISMARLIPKESNGRLDEVSFCE